MSHSDHCARCGYARREHIEAAGSLLCPEHTFIKAPSPDTGAPCFCPKAPAEPLCVHERLRGRIVDNGRGQLVYRTPSEEEAREADAFIRSRLVAPPSPAKEPDTGSAVEEPDMTPCGCGHVRGIHSEIVGCCGFTFRGYVGSQPEVVRCECKTFQPPRAPGETEGDGR